MVVEIVFFLLVLVVILIFIAAGYPVSETILSYFKLGIEKIKHPFSRENPSATTPNPKPISSPPLPMPQIPMPEILDEISMVLEFPMEEEDSEEEEKEEVSSESSSESSSECSDEEQNNRFYFPEVEPPIRMEDNLEVEMSEAVPLPQMPLLNIHRTLENAIETPSTTPFTREEAVPIDEYDVPEDINGWCYIGESKGARGCAPVGKMDKCITGEVYVNQMECLKIHPENAPKPPGPYDAYYETNPMTTPLPV
jgi:hypothetical protein